MSVVCKNIWTFLKQVITRMKGSQTPTAHIYIVCLLSRASSSSNGTVNNVVIFVVRDRCSENLLFFLCSIFSPICTTNYLEKPVPPCREICEQVKSGCEPVIISKYNKTWPENIDCASFPQYNNGVCLSPQAIQLQALSTEKPAQVGSSLGEY